MEVSGGMILGVIATLSSALAAMAGGMAVMWKVEQDRNMMHEKGRDKREDQLLTIMKENHKAFYQNIESNKELQMVIREQSNVLKQMIKEQQNTKNIVDKLADVVHGK